MRQSKKRKSGSLFFQPKLMMSQPGDKYEQEADAVAEQIMQTNESISSQPFFPSSFMQKNAAGTMQSSSGGQALTQQEQSFFGHRTGYDFSRVKLHTDTTANVSAKSVQAKAYTQGNDIVFAKGEYQPHTQEGKKLLAHELTHVMQQNSGNAPAQMVQREADKDPSQFEDELLQSEYEAYKEHMYYIQPEDYASEEENMSYFNALEKEVRERCIKSSPSHPAEVEKELIDRITGKYEKIDGDPGEGLMQTPYIAPEGQCTIGYGHVIKKFCSIKTETTEDNKEKKSCECTPEWTAISKERAIAVLKEDMVTNMNEVHKKIKVDLTGDEFDAMVDLSAHVGSLPDHFVNYVHQFWCTDKEAVRNKYLKTAITMKDPKTKQDIVMKNFVDRRRRRAW